MKTTRVDVAVIGGGPAGLGAAASAKQHGAHKVVVLDRNTWLGGILPQCIHDGFGVEELGRSLTGPEYADLYIEKATQQGIQFLTETMVLRISSDRNIIAINKKGMHQIQAHAIVLATGCREKTRWHALIPGTRPSGIFTAGVAQAFINLYNIMPGKRVVILGSGDVGLIMARRLTYEGAKVLAVIELLPYASGLPRNIVQCLDDYGIPLFFNHTITKIQGKHRLEQVTIQQIDSDMNPVPNTEQNINCDTLLLSLGLIPENELAQKAGMLLDPSTGGAIVNQNLETTLPQVFACGNCLQVYDTVDLLSIDAQRAGKHAAETLTHQQKHTTSNKQKQTVTVLPGQGVRYVIPQQIHTPGQIHFTLRALKPSTKATVHVVSDEDELFTKRLPWINPACMISFDASIPQKILTKRKDIMVNICEP